MQFYFWYSTCNMISCFNIFIWCNTFIWWNTFRVVNSSDKEIYKTNGYLWYVCCRQLLPRPYFYYNIIKYYFCFYSYLHRYVYSYNINYWYTYHTISSNHILCTMLQIPNKYNRLTHMFIINLINCLSQQKYQYRVLC